MPGKMSPPRAVRPERVSALLIAVETAGFQVHSVEIRNDGSVALVFQPETTEREVVQRESAAEYAMRQRRARKAREAKEK